MLTAQNQLKALDTVHNKGIGLNTIPNVPANSLYSPLEIGNIAYV